MTTLRFQDHDDFVEITLTSQETQDVPSRGDAHSKITVCSAGFQGQCETWIFEEALRSFCQSLVALERARHGEAVLESMSPDELRIRVRSIDSRGHMVVEGTTGRYVRGENSWLWHSVSFGFEFDPSQLVTAVNVDWVKRNAEPTVPNYSPAASESLGADAGRDPGTQAIEPITLPVGPEQLLKCFRADSMEEPEDPHWRNGVTMCERWLAFIARADVSQAEIDGFVERLASERNCGTGWLDLGLQFRSWARKNGFKA